MADPVFGGGGGPGVAAGAAPPKELTDLFDALTKRAITEYLIDPDGAKIEITFYPASGTVSIEAGGIVTNLPYRKVV